MENFPKYYDPQTLAKVKDLELKARRIIEGFVSGSHKSPFQGVSVEFAQHREYVVGDDVRHIDWKVFGKTDKFYLKQYEQETNLVCNVLLDVSSSMDYGSAATTKLEFARHLAAALAYLVIHQSDSIGMVFFEDQIRYQIPPSGASSHLKQVFHVLANCEPANVPSNLGRVLDELAERLNKRSLILILSDCFDDLERILAGLKHLRYRRHEVVLFHVLDRAELEFDFQQLTLFKGLEGLPDMLTEPKGLRKAYLKEFGDFLFELQRGCRATNVDYQLARTDQPIGQYLATYLAERGGKKM